jgi:hypothetical protein
LEHIDDTIEIDLHRSQPWIYNYLGNRLSDEAEPATALIIADKADP